MRRVACAAKTAALVAFIFGCASVADAGDCVAPPAPEPIAVDAAYGATAHDRVGRVVAPVFVNGEGPFRFVVDTGANRSVLSARLAQRLGLAIVGDGEVHSISGVQTAPMAAVNSLSYGALSLHRESMPVLEGGVFAGEWGLLGVDGMQGRRLRMNFQNNCIEISDARGARPLRGWVTIEGELRFGHLLLADARVRNVEIRVLIDTGSDVSLGNPALREALLNVRGRRVDAQSFTAGEVLVLDHSVIVPRLALGEMRISNVPAYIGDYHIFRLWGLENEPTMLLGMDVLSQAHEIAIDYERALLQFRIDDRGYSAPRAFPQ